MSDEQAEYLIDVIRARIPIPLPHVPTDATCGGCRWFKLCPNGQKYCVVEPVLVSRVCDHPACRHYQEKPK